MRHSSGRRRSRDIGRFLVPFISCVRRSILGVSSIHTKPITDLVIKKDLSPKVKVDRARRRRGYYCLLLLWVSDRSSVQVPPTSSSDSLRSATAPLHRKHSEVLDELDRPPWQMECAAAESPSGVTGAGAVGLTGFQLLGVHRTHARRGVGTGAWSSGRPHCLCLALSLRAQL
jgi:hypothetical protein